MQFEAFIAKHIKRYIDIAPLITFRILFGGLMLVGALRFMYSGWIEKLYLEPRFFFKYYGFEWIQPLDKWGMYALMITVVVSAAMIMLGFLYRWSVLIFFLSFSYVELIDATNYLNHYYLVCLLSIVLFFLPANRAFSLDTLCWPSLKTRRVPAWTINILKLQLGLVYTFAGLAKLNPDWLFHAMPLAIWLPEHGNWPVLGPIFQQSWAAYAFSWAGAIYDLTIAWFLLFRVTRPWAYIAVLIFHGLTWMLFNIGLFPFIMSLGTLIFFSAESHRRWLSWIGYRPNENDRQAFAFHPALIRILRPALIGFFIIQTLLPFRFLLYPGHLLWTEQGYRFSWRVMLVEKVGLATFTVEDSATGRRSEIQNARYLTPFQEKQMSIQPDFILQYAHFLKKEYQTHYQIEKPIVTVDAHVALNGRVSQRFIDPEVDLAQLKDGFRPKSWILPFQN